MTRPAGRVKGVSKSRGSGRVGSLRSKISQVGSDQVKRFSKSRGSGRVGSRGFKFSRVGSGWVKRFQNLAGRVGSGQEGFKISRVGSGHDPRDTGHFAGQAIMTRELFWTDPRVKPADLAGGSALFKLTAESHSDAAQAPRVGPAGPPIKYKHFHFLPSSCRCSDHMSSQRAEQSPGSTPSYSYQGIQQCDANPVPTEAVTTVAVVILRSYQYEM